MISRWSFMTCRQSLSPLYPFTSEYSFFFKPFLLPLLPSFFPFYLFTLLSCFALTLLSCYPFFTTVRDLPDFKALWLSVELPACLGHIFWDFLPLMKEIPTWPFSTDFSGLGLLRTWETDIPNVEITTALLFSFSKTQVSLCLCI